MGPSGPQQTPPFSAFDRSCDSAETWDGPRYTGAVEAGWAPAAGADQALGADAWGLWKSAMPFPEHPAERSTTTLANIGRGTPRGVFVSEPGRSEGLASARGFPYARDRWGNVRGETGGGSWR